MLINEFNLMWFIGFIEFIVMDIGIMASWHLLTGEQRWTLRVFQQFGAAILVDGDWATIAGENVRQVVDAEDNHQYTFPSFFEEAWCIGKEHYLDRLARGQQ